MGLGGYPGQNGTGHPIEHDPAEELNAQDLELPTGDDGREVMIGRRALKVSCSLMKLTIRPRSPFCFATPSQHS